MILSIPCECIANAVISLRIWLEHKCAPIELSINLPNHCASHVPSINIFTAKPSSDYYQSILWQFIECRSPEYSEDTKKTPWIILQFWSGRRVVWIAKWLWSVVGIQIDCNKCHNLSRIQTALVQRISNNGLSLLHTQTHTHTYKYRSTFARSLLSPMITRTFATFAIHLQTTTKKTANKNEKWLFCSCHYQFSGIF